MKSCRLVDVKIGVLALQGNVSEHIDAFRLALIRMGHTTSSEVFEVRHPEDLAGCDALAIPGGESTTISRLIDKNHMYEPIRSFSGGIFATCAGMVLVATMLMMNASIRWALSILRWIGMLSGDSGNRSKLTSPSAGLEGGPFHAIFIRAPVATSAGPGVTVLSSMDQGIVAVEYGKHMALSFHPELSCDTRLHERFLKKLGV